MFSKASPIVIGGATFLSNASNITFGGASFIGNNASLAPNAILNAGGRADETRCHPGTREEVIGCIDNWRDDAQHGLTARRIFWLTGPAGAGKTAIVQTVAERWASRGVHTANFFFFRADPSRNHAHPLVITLLHQIFNFYSNARPVVDGILAQGPRVLGATLTEQFDTLICSSLRSLAPSFSQPIVLLIDGLDECTSGRISQRDILHALDALVTQNDLPFLALVASRIEPKITEAFEKLRSKVDSVFLDDKYSPSKDIRLFVTAEFDKIKRTHHLAPQDENWPLPSDIDGIVTKSSGQFVYAATAMRFISESPADPRVSLTEVQGTAHIASTVSPFALLDSMYTHILCRARDQEALVDILHSALILNKPTNKAFNGMLYRVLNTLDRRYTASVVEECISDVTSIVYIRRRELLFHHASFDDFLQNQSRSGKYFFNLARFGPKVLHAIWEHIGKTQGVQFAVDFAPNEVESVLPDFMNTIIELQPADFATYSNVQEMKTVFRIVYSLCVKNHNVANYQRMIRSWITHYVSLIPSDSQDKTLSGLPWSKRYITMAQIDHSPEVTEPTPAIADVLRLSSSSPFDVREMSLWVKNLLHRIHTNYYPHDLIRYKQLMEKWISFACSNGIPLNKLNGLPHARQYLR